MEIDDLIFPACILGILALIATAIWAGLVEQRNWDAFAIAHECKKVGEISPSSSVGIGFGSNGQTSIVPITTPGKTGFACNDGVTYWR